MYMPLHSVVYRYVCTIDIDIERVVLLLLLYVYDNRPVYRLVLPAFLYQGLQSAYQIAAYNCIYTDMMMGRPIMQVARSYHL